MDRWEYMDVSGYALADILTEREERYGSTPEFKVIDSWMDEESLAVIPQRKFAVLIRRQNP